MAEITIIRRVNPKTGKTELPWRDRKGNFVLADPRLGAQLHHRENAILTAEYDEVVRLVRLGHSIRMSAGDGSPPTLIRAASVEILDGDHVETATIPEARDTAPFPKEVLMRDLQKALIAEAAMVAYWGSDQAAAAFIGFAPEGGEPYESTRPEEVDLSRFRATNLLSAAYDWAFQVGEPECFGPEMWDDLGALMDGASNGVITAMSPMAKPDSAIRATIETAFARWKLEHEPWLSLSVRQLAYLAQMDEVSARNALGKAGIKGRGGVSNDVARTWLWERQRFIPTRPELVNLVASESA